MDGAAQNGALEVVQWLHENRDEGCTGDALFFASKVRRPYLFLPPGREIAGEKLFYVPNFMFVFFLLFAPRVHSWRTVSIVVWLKLSYRSLTELFDLLNMRPTLIPSELLPKTVVYFLRFVELFQDTVPFWR